MLNHPEEHDDILTRIKKQMIEVSLHTCCVKDCEKPANSVGNGQYYCMKHFWEALDKITGEL